MRRPLIAGNWKMHGSSAFVDEYVGAFAGAELPAGVTVLLIPPVAYLARLADALTGTAVELGAQAAHTESSGAFTGETAAEMVADLGARWLLVGHSERRQLFGETDAVVAAKYAAALRAGLSPVLCVGETLEEREADRAETVVRGQLQAVAEAVGGQALLQGVVAYEPVWAIGTGHTATPEQAQAMHQMIRAELAAIDDAAADAMPLLYGGSVNPGNAGDLLAQPDIDGGLVGGASLKPEDFAAIVAAARP